MGNYFTIHMLPLQGEIVNIDSAPSVSGGQDLDGRPSHNTAVKVLKGKLGESFPFNYSH